MLARLLKTSKLVEIKIGGSEVAHVRVYSDGTYAFESLDLFTRSIQRWQSFDAEELKGADLEYYEELINKIDKRISEGEF